VTPDKRWELIHRPFPIITHGTTARWSGCIAGDSFPVGREGVELLHDDDVDPFPVKGDYVIMQVGGNHGKRYLPESHHWPTKKIATDSEGLQGLHFGKGMRRRTS
jgi:hypothetical protein